MVDELRAVVAIDARHGERHRLNERVESGQHVHAGVVPDGMGVHPAGVHAGEVHTPGELALQGGPAMGDRVDLEEPGFALDLVTGLAYLDRLAQQVPGLGAGLAADRVPRFGRRQVAVDRGRGHGLELGTDPVVVVLHPGHQ